MGECCLQRRLSPALGKVREPGLQDVLVTRETDNIASARVIDNYGGLLAGQAIFPHCG